MVLWTALFIAKRDLLDLFDLFLKTMEPSLLITQHVACENIRVFKNKHFGYVLFVILRLALCQCVDFNSVIREYQSTQDVSLEAT